MNASIAFEHSKDDCEYCSNKNKQPEEQTASHQTHYTYWTPSNSGTQSTDPQEQTSVTKPVFPSDDDLFITL